MRRALKQAAGLALLALTGAVLPASAQAVSSAPAWSLDSLAEPTNFTAAHNARCEETLGGRSLVPCDAYVLRGTDSGAKRTTNAPITLSDAVPAGLAVRKIELFWVGEGAGTAGVANTDLSSGRCTPAPASCTITPGEGKLPAFLSPDEELVMRIYVSVEEPEVAGQIENQATVSGGGAPGASASEQNAIGEAPAPFGTAFFNAPLNGIDGQPDVRAAGHPYELATRIGLHSVVRFAPNNNEKATSTEDLKDAIVDLPPGVVGSAVATPTCTQAQMLNSASAGSGCPRNTVVGHLRTEPKGGFTSVDSPLFNMVPEHGTVAEFGYVDIAGGMHVLYVSLAPTPQGYVVRTSGRDTPQVALTWIATTIFGDPASKDGTANHIAMLTNPASCDGEPLVTSIHADSWQSPGPYSPDGSPDFSDPRWVSSSYESPPVSGCNALHFEPTIEAKPTTTQGDSPSGLDFKIDVPQPTDFATLATPPLKRAVVDLPEGMSVNPSSANGLAACSLAQLGMSAQGQPDAAEPHCPDASKIGTLEVKTPALAETLEGNVYLAEQGNNPFGSLIALYMVIDDPARGVVVKIPAEVRADPQSGRLETIVDNSPQLPFSELAVHLFAGTRAPLRTPAVCGKYEVGSALTPYSAPESGPPATPKASFEITDGCAESAGGESHSPSFSAGTIAPVAGSYSPFVMRMARPDGSQELSGLSVALPEGLTGKLAGVAECPEAQVAAARARSATGQGAAEFASPSCPQSSQIGSLTVGAGAGLTPYYASGRVYLAGPYQGAPLSALVITPAVAGPFDLGVVAVRVALRLDPQTAQITAVSDPLPRILDGIPLDLRSLDLRMGRDQFTLNPTSCAKKQIGASAISALGGSAALSSPFQVGGCAALPFKPRLSLRLAGKSARGGFPALRAVYSAPAGGANLRSMVLRFPHSEFVEQGHFQTICTNVQWAAGAGSGSACPAGSIYGHVRATSPLLDAPLEGPVYLRSSKFILPDVVFALRGQIDAEVEVHVDSAKGGLRARVDSAPDVPVSKVVLDMRGGQKGLFVNSRDVCSRTYRANLSLTAQSGKEELVRPPLKASCGKGRAKHHGKRGAGRAR